MKKGLVGLLNSKGRTVRIRAGWKVIWHENGTSKGTFNGCIVFVDEKGERVKEATCQDHNIQVPFIRNEKEFFDFVEVIAKIHGLGVTLHESVDAQLYYEIHYACFVSR